MEPFVLVKGDGSRAEIRPSPGTYEWEIQRRDVSGAKGTTRVGIGGVLVNVPAERMIGFGSWLERLLIDPERPPAGLWDAVQAWAAGDVGRLTASLDLLTMRAGWATLAQATLAAFPKGEDGLDELDDEVRDAEVNEAQGFVELSGPALAIPAGTSRVRLVFEQ